jgi:putative Holliday junction resolvase
MALVSILALDVGERRIGTAVCDPSGSFALPYDVLERTNIKDDLVRIRDLARERNATVIVVGDPIAMNGTRGIAAEKMDAFVASLGKVWDGEIARVDERLTTAAVNKTLIGADVKRAKRKQVVDKMAAAMILETYLQRRRNA